MIRVQRLSSRLVGLAGLVSVIGLASLTGCAHYAPPLTQPPGATAPSDPGEATLVFLWPYTSCDPPGYFTLATAKGQFLGNISRGSRLSVPIPPGETTVVGWNALMEDVTGGMRRATAPVLHAHVRAGHTYYVQMLIGDWNESGPVEAWHRGGRGRFPTRACGAVPHGATSAMVVVAPGLDGPPSGPPAWAASLEPLVPDLTAGQAWLDQNRSLLEAHAAVSEDRFVGLRPQAKRLATIEPTDDTP